MRRGLDKWIACFPFHDFENQGHNDEKTAFAKPAPLTKRHQRSQARKTAEHFINI